MRRDNALAY